MQLLYQPYIHRISQQISTYPRLLAKLTPTYTTAATPTRRRKNLAFHLRILCQVVNLLNLLELALVVKVEVFE
jgi:hypothetical protein